ncbi:unnamed protein product [Phytophthora lilii]|uniref:Unnamed protein product n=1 Tax=Phytophthora lilii TaxID=2077276 RepID=A0A9W6WSI9_9STRA|nr:unnamed protein product [Phytophthora lilii]
MDSKLKLFRTISKNKGLLESNGLRKKIVPILDGAIKTSPIDNQDYVWVDGNSISVYGKESNRTKPVITKKVNWVLSLRSFINMVRDRGLELEIIGKNEEEIDAKDFAPGHGEAQHGTMSGIDEDMNPKLNRYLKDVQYPFPSSDEEATELVKEKKLNQQRRKNLGANLKILNEVILKSAHDITRQSSEEYDHDDNWQNLHDDSAAAFQAYGEAQKHYEEAKKAVKGSNSKSARSALKAATSAMKATKAVYLAKSKKYNQASHVKIMTKTFLIAKIRDRSMPLVEEGLRVVA